MRTPFIAALIALTPLAAFADETSGTVLAYDRVANILVLGDKSVWSLETLKEVPADLSAGQRVTITYTSNGDNGWSAINAVTITDKG
ncbi:hypothetical protein [Roseivivax sp. CAU 1753]